MRDQVARGIFCEEICRPQPMESSKGATGNPGLPLHTPALHNHGRCVSGSRRQPTFVEYNLLKCYRKAIMSVSNPSSL
jgi:hypothetical protein